MSHDYAIQKTQQQLVDVRRQMEVLEQRLAGVLAELKQKEDEIHQIREELSKKADRTEAGYEFIITQFATRQEASKEALQAWVRDYVAEATRPASE